MNHSNEELRARMDAEARISEAAAYDDSDADAPLPAHVKVSRPNRRPRVLQVRLSDDEFDALERVAAGRDVKVSTVAREQLLKLIEAPAGGSHRETVYSVAAQLVTLATDLQDSLASQPGLGALTLDRVLGGRRAAK